MLVDEKKGNSDQQCELVRPTESKEKLVVVLNDPLSLKVQIEPNSVPKSELELKLQPTKTTEAAPCLASQITEDESSEHNIDA